MFMLSATSSRTFCKGPTRIAVMLPNFSPFIGCCKALKCSGGFASVERIFSHKKVGAADSIKELVRI